jgi:hypothetical protein
VLIFVGAGQNKLSFEIVKAIQLLGFNAEYIKIAGNGSNALDFHIAYYIGDIAAKDPTAYFHTVSKDSGFDPLIQHLKAKKIFAYRVSDIADIPALKTIVAQSPEERASLIIKRLAQPKQSKPRTVKTLQQLRQLNP